MAREHQSQQEGTGDHSDPVLHITGKSETQGAGGLVNTARRKSSSRARTRVQIWATPVPGLWGAPASCLARGRSQPLLEAPTPSLQKESISKGCALPGNIFTPSVLVICCCKKPNARDQNNIYLLYHTSWGRSLAQLSLDPLVGVSQGYNHSIDWATFLSELGCSSRPHLWWLIESSSSWLED